MENLQVSQYEEVLKTLVEQGAYFGLAILKALLIFVVGKLLIKVINNVVKKVLLKRDIDPSVGSFVSSVVNVSLLILLIISIIGVLGIQTSSFAALLASAGVAIGMALSGNLSNFAGGIIILLFKPFRVGDFITAQGVSGTVNEIQIFHTIIYTTDNVRIYLPNGSLSNSIVNNFNVDKRRVEWIFNIEYGEDYENAKAVISRVLAKEKRLLANPEPFIALHKLDDSSINLMARVWVNASDYWGVYFDINKEIYDTFNKEGVNFAFPQLMVHKK